MQRNRENSITSTIITIWPKSSIQLVRVVARAPAQPTVASKKPCRSWLNGPKTSESFGLSQIHSKILKRPSNRKCEVEGTRHFDNVVHFMFTFTYIMCNCTVGGLKQFGKYYIVKIQNRPFSRGQGRQRCPIPLWGWSKGQSENLCKMSSEHQWLLSFHASFQRLHLSSLYGCCLASCLPVPCNILSQLRH